MKLTKKIVKFFIFCVYIITLFLSPSSWGIDIIDSLRRNLVVILPAILILLIIFNNRKNLKIILKNKFPLILYFMCEVWLFLTFLFGIKTGPESLKGFIHFSVLMTLMLVLFNCKLEKEDKEKIKKHIFLL